MCELLVGLGEVDQVGIDPAGLRRPMREQAGLQRFFHSAGRAFCLHAAIGAYNHRHPLTPEANAILSNLTIE